MKPRVVFFGTHAFATTILRRLLSWELIDLPAVVTQPDKPSGRKKIPTPSPVSMLLRQHGYAGDILTPSTLKNSELAGALAVYAPDIFMVVEYGKLIPQSILNIPRKGAINVHPSLLPEYRGPAPIQQALIDGKQITGTTIMLLDAEMDHGPVLAQREIVVLPQETFLELRERLAQASADLLRETIPAYLLGELTPTEQDHNKATYMRMIERKDGEINWHNSAQDIYNRYRGLTPWPGVYSHLHSSRLGANGKRCKLLSLGMTDMPSSDQQPGSLYADRKRLFVATSTTYLELFKLQLEGKKELSAAEFIQGLR